jgi:hypothetical protein
MVDPEFWILETAFDVVIPLSMLVRPDLEQFSNKTGHGLGRRELAQLLERLLWEGKISIVGGGRPAALYSAVELEPLFRDKGPKICYQLTPKGGDRWEALAQPEWDRYIQHGTYSAHEEVPARYEFISESRALLERFVEVYFLWSGRGCLPGSERWDVVTPWKPAFWKDRPSAWRFQALEDPDPVRRETPLWPFEEFGRLTRWCRRSGDSE